MNSIKTALLLTCLISIPCASAAQAGNSPAGNATIHCKIAADPSNVYAPTQVEVQYQAGQVLAGYVSSTQSQPLGATSVRVAGNTYVYGFRVTSAVPVPQAQREGYSHPTFWQKVSETLAEAEEYLDGSDDSFMERARTVTHIYYNSKNPAQSNIQIEYLRASRTSFATIGPFVSEELKIYPLECSLSVSK